MEQPGVTPELTPQSPEMAAIHAVLRLAAELDAEVGYDASDGRTLGEVISHGDRIREVISAALLERGVRL